MISPLALAYQLNTDVESHVRSMSTCKKHVHRQRLPSMSTEDVSEN